MTGPEPLGNALDSILKRFRPRPNPKAEAARRKEAAKSSSCDPIPGLSWIDPALCDAKTLQAVRYHVGERDPVFLWGTPGGGKTAIAGAVCLEEVRRVAAEKEIDPTIVAAGMWGTAAELVAMIRAARYGKGIILPGASLEITEGHLWRRFGRDQLLVVDDLGVGGFDETSYEILWRLADIRQRIPTIWTSNLSPDRVRSELDPRIHSRVCCGAVIELAGKDRRLARQKQFRRVQEG